MRRDPDKAEILGLHRRTGASPAAIVDQLYGALDDQERPRAIDRVKKILRRDRERQEPQGTPNRGPAGDDAPSPARIVVADRHFEPGRLDRIPWIERQLARLEAAMDAALDSGNIGRVTQIASAMSDHRQQLDQARAEAGRRVKLDRNPGAVAAELDRKRKALEILAGAHRVKERDL